jgi:hypothetical protein
MSDNSGTSAPETTTATRGVVHCEYRTARLLDYAEEKDYDEVGDLHEVLAAAAGVRCDNHVVFIVREVALMQRIREVFGHPEQCRSAEEQEELLTLANRADLWGKETPRMLARTLGYAPCGLYPEDDQLCVMFTDLKVHLGHGVVRERW